MRRPPAQLGRRRCRTPHTHPALRTATIPHRAATDGVRRLDRLQHSGQQEGLSPDGCRCGEQYTADVSRSNADVHWNPDSGLTRRVDCSRISAIRALKRRAMRQGLARHAAERKTVAAGAFDAHGSPQHEHRRLADSPGRQPALDGCGNTRWTFGTRGAIQHHVVSRGAFIHGSPSHGPVIKRKTTAVEDLRTPGSFTGRRP